MTIKQIVYLFLRHQDELFFDVDGTLINKVGDNYSLTKLGEVMKALCQRGHKINVATFGCWPADELAKYGLLTNIVYGPVELCLNGWTKSIGESVTDMDDVKYLPGNLILVDNEKKNCSKENSIFYQDWEVA